MSKMAAVQNNYSSLSPTQTQRERGILIWILKFITLAGIATLIYATSYANLPDFHHFESVYNYMFYNSKLNSTPTLVGGKINSKMVEDKKPKLILLWSEAYGDPSIEGWGASNSKSFLECPYNCEFTKNKKLLNVSHALFYEGLPATVYTSTLPSLKSRQKFPNQIWGLFRIESPANQAVDMHGLDNLFNWTVTYRSDADIYWPSVKIYPATDQYAVNKPRTTPPTLESLKGKNLVAWMVSNCHTETKRENYVQILQKFIPVDIYGRCGSGQFQCDLSLNEGCYERLAKTYKFYLSFENSLCVDYQTEKYYYPMRYGMIPVVFAHPSFTKTAVPGSYINIYDFKSAEALANHLLYLDSHPEEYLKYFEWTKDFVVLSNADSFNSTWCNVCTKLHKTDFSIVKKSYRSVHDWFFQNYTGKVICDRLQFNENGTFL